MEAGRLRVEPVPVAWQPALPVFASGPFLASLSDERGWIGGVDPDGRLRCVLPYVIIRKGVFRMVRFPVETIDLCGDLTVDMERQFLGEAVRHLGQSGADVIVPATFNSVFRTYPQGAIAAPYGTLLIDLAQPEDVLWKNLHSKHRNVVRNAQNKGVRVRSGRQHVDTAYRLVRESFGRSARGALARARLGLRSDEAGFRRQIEALGDNAAVFVAEHEGIVQAAAVIPFSAYRGYYMHGGSIAKPVTGAMNLLQWEVILHLRSAGVRHYDFFGARIRPEQGSKIDGIMKFKERFGGAFVSGYMWKFPFRPLKYRLYCAAARIRNGGDVVDQERHKMQLSE